MCVFIPHLIPGTLRLTTSGLAVRKGTDKISVEADEIIFKSNPTDLPFYKLNTVRITFKLQSTLHFIVWGRGHCAPPLGTAPRQTDRSGGVGLHLSQHTRRAHACSHSTRPSVSRSSSHILCIYYLDFAFCEACLISIALCRSKPCSIT
jgi:hypothetical protein